MDFESANEYKAIQESVNLILPCYQISIVRPQGARYVVLPDSTIQGAGLTVKCVKKAPENFSVTLTWTAPTQRENGDPLPISEISHFLLEYIDRSFEIPRDQTSFVVNGLPAGEITFSLWTVDAEGLRSSTPNTATTTLQ
jgi:hypothetical protein